MRQIRVHVVEASDRDELRLRYTDPVTGRRRTKSAGTSNRRKALRAAVEWEQELNDGRYGDSGDCPWEVFRGRYEAEHLSGLSDRTFQRACEVLGSFAAACNPQRLADVTSDKISRYVGRLRKRGLAASTVATHLAHLRTALNWSRSAGLIRQVPEFPRPPRGRRKRMKGRPLTNAEFAAYLRAVPLVLDRRLCRPWLHYLKGLWWSGLRLEESLGLSWDDPSGLMVDTTRKHLALIVPAEAEKGGRDRILPIAREFVQFLEQTPADERTGPVFRPTGHRGERVTADRVSRIGSAIGKASGVSVLESGSQRHPTIHDLRRSFGLRWAKEVMPAVLMVMMRHEDIHTTMDFYVGRNADDVAAIVSAPEKGSRAGSRQKRTGSVD